MDPTAALIDALSALNSGDSEWAAMEFANLARWLETGGFSPDLTNLGLREQLDNAAKLARERG